MLNQHVARSSLGFTGERCLLYLIFHFKIFTSKYFKLQGYFKVQVKIFTLQNIHFSAIFRFTLETICLTKRYPIYYTSFLKFVPLKKKNKLINNHR
jgi:hypothetical protein